MSKHSDCKNFVQFDVFKGFCRKNGGFVLIDTDICPAFAEKAKCRNCSHFCGVNEEGIGMWKGLESEYWAYEDMDAKTCEGYETK